MKFIFLSNFLFLIINGLASITNQQQQEQDILYPYVDGAFHIDSTRSHRHARSCMLHYNDTQTFQSIKTTQVENQIKLHRFRTKNSKKEIVYGHRAVIKNPLKLVSVLEPSKGDSCKSRTLTPVAETAINGKCYIATNAGFFQPFSNKKNFGECYGNIVSNGRYVQDSNGTQNANFGIRKDGTIVVGYLSEVDVLSKENPFIQLVSGVGWVLKNGALFVDESKSIECMDTQTTGSDRFFNAHSARVLIGFDGNGYVHLVQFDGKTDEGGVNLKEAGLFMKSLGVINAINLDGGGSATFVVDGVVTNYPSDGCRYRTNVEVNFWNYVNDAKDKNNICERNVSTIICINHPERSQNETVLTPSCSNNDFVIIIILAIFLGVALFSNIIFVKLYYTYRYQAQYDANNLKTSTAKYYDNEVKDSKGMLEIEQV